VIPLKAEVALNNKNSGNEDDKDQRYKKVSSVHCMKFETIKGEKKYEHNS
jgi:hypothetical protein